MNYFILSSNKEKSSAVAHKLQSMSSFNTYIGSCWGAIVCVFGALGEWEALESALVGTKKSSLNLFSWKQRYDVSQHYSYLQHERTVDSDVEVRVPLLNLHSKELVYFVLNKLTYQSALDVLQTSVQSIWDNPIIINGSIYVEPSLFGSNCFYHILAHDKDAMPNEVDVLFPSQKVGNENEPWDFVGTKSVISRVLDIVRGRNMHRCTYEIRTLAEANSVMINYHYLD